MPDSPTSESEPDFVCDCEESMRSACAGEPFYEEYEAKRYCVLHFPGNEKSTAFDRVLKRKLEAQDFDFRGVWFSGPFDFSNFEFSAEANFSYAIFRGDANFNGATFNSPAYFASTFWLTANFKDATFQVCPSLCYFEFSGLFQLSHFQLGGKLRFLFPLVGVLLSSPVRRKASFPLSLALQSKRIR